MGGLIDILKFSASSIVWGVLIALAMMALFVFIVRSWWKDALFTVPTYLVGAVLAVLLMFQCTMIVGALKIISMTDTYQPVVENFVSYYFTPDEIVTEEKADVVLADFIGEFPLVEHYIHNGTFKGMEASQLATIMMDKLRDYMRSYIVRRLLWSLGFVVVLGIVGIKTIRRSSGGRQRLGVAGARNRSTAGALDSRSGRHASRRRSRR